MSGLPASLRLLRVLGGRHNDATHDFARFPRHMWALPCHVRLDEVRLLGYNNGAGSVQVLRRHALQALGLARPGSEGSLAQARVEVGGGMQRRRRLAAVDACSHRQRVSAPCSMWHQRRGLKGSARAHLCPCRRSTGAATSRSC